MDKIDGAMCLRPHGELVLAGGRAGGVSAHKQMCTKACVAFFCDEEDQSPVCVFSE